ADVGAEYSDWRRRKRRVRHQSVFAGARRDRLGAVSGRIDGLARQNPPGTAGNAAPGIRRISLRPYGPAGHSEAEGKSHPLVFKWPGNGNPAMARRQARSDGWNQAVSWRNRLGNGARVGYGKPFAGLRGNFPAADHGQGIEGSRRANSRTIAGGRNA